MRSENERENRQSGNTVCPVKGKQPYKGEISRKTRPPWQKKGIVHFQRRWHLAKAAGELNVKRFLFAASTFVYTRDFSLHDLLLMHPLNLLSKTQYITISLIFQMATSQQQQAVDQEFLPSVTASCQGGLMTIKVETRQAFQGMLRSFIAFLVDIVPSDFPPRSFLILRDANQ